MRFATVLLMMACAARATTFYVTVAGLGGEPDYEQRFSGWAGEIEAILKSAGGDAKIETFKGAAATRANVRTALERIAHEAKPDDALVVMLIGHGSFDGVDYKINLPGPDLSATDLAALLDRVPAARQLVVDMTSSSGGAINTLRKENRVVITATKSGTERNATVFAAFLGGGAPRSGGRHGQERNHLGARGLPLRRAEGGRIFRIAETPGHRASDARRYREGRRRARSFGG